MFEYSLLTKFGLNICKNNLYRAEISVEEAKGVDLTELLGEDIKKDWGSEAGSPLVGSSGGAPVGSLGDEVPHKLKLFCETPHNICIKIHCCCSYLIK